MNYVKNKRFTRYPLMVLAGLLIIGNVPEIDFSLPIFYKFDKVILSCANINNLYYKIKIESKKINQTNNESDKAIKATKKILYIPRIK